MWKNNITFLYKAFHYVETQWNALYKKVILCDGNWNDLDFLSGLAIYGYLSDKYED